MENLTHADQIKLLQALQRDLTTALADLKKIKAKLGIDQPAPPPVPSPPGPGPVPGQPIK